MHEPGGSLIDHARTTCLCDVGLPGHLIAVCVDPDGTDRLWLVDVAELGKDDPAAGNRDQPHEQLGRLPVRWRDRNELRCGRPTHKGRPCRRRVKESGHACGSHCEGRP